jgi:hypothetical protein
MSVDSCVIILKVAERRGDDPGSTERMNVVRYFISLDMDVTVQGSSSPLAVLHARDLPEQLASLDQESVRSVLESLGAVRLRAMPRVG